MTEIHFSLIALGAIILGLGLTSDFEEQKSIADNYCEMVEIHKRTGGGAGWPDYKGTYDEQCR